MVLFPAEYFPLPNYKHNKSSSDPSIFGQAVTFSATVTPKISGTPTGTVKFRDGLKILGTSPLNAGTAKFSTATLAVGRHCITAAYS
ncbi:MAG: Ig-like domain-containing protein, partial [Terriglobales bacterium]